MISASGAANIGPIVVQTMDYRGFSPEELADRAVDRIIKVGQNSHPAIIEQARAFREDIRKILVDYFRTAQEAERNNIYGKLIKADQPEIAELVRRL